MILHIHFIYCVNFGGNSVLSSIGLEIRKYGTFWETAFTTQKHLWNCLKEPWLPPRILCEHADIHTVWKSILDSVKHTDTHCDSWNWPVKFDSWNWLWYGFIYLLRSNLVLRQSAKGPWVKMLFSVLVVLIHELWQINPLFWFQYDPQVFLCWTDWWNFVQTTIFMTVLSYSGWSYCRF